MTVIELVQQVIDHEEPGTAVWVDGFFEQGRGYLVAICVKGHIRYQSDIEATPDVLEAIENSLVNAGFKTLTESPVHDELGVSAYG